MKNFKSFINEGLLANGYNTSAPKHTEEQIMGMSDEEIQKIFSEFDELYYIMTDNNMSWYESMSNNPIGIYIRDNMKGLRDGIILRVRPELLRDVANNVDSIPNLEKDTALYKILKNAIEFNVSY